MADTLLDISRCSAVPLALKEANSDKCTQEYDQSDNPFHHALSCLRPEAMRSQLVTSFVSCHSICYHTSNFLRYLDEVPVGKVGVACRCGRLGTHGRPTGPGP